MTTASASASASTTQDRDGDGDGDGDGDRDRGPTLAQWYCYVIGAVLTLAGIFGFTADATFDTSGSKPGDGFLGFEVNGWHNVVHLVSGIVLLLLASKRGSARTGAIAFGAIYLILTIIGLIDGNDILNFVPVNEADNVLHIVLSAFGLIAGLASKGDPDRDADRIRAERVDPPPTAPAEPERDRARESYLGGDQPKRGPQGSSEPPLVGA